MMNPGKLESQREKTRKAHTASDHEAIFIIAVRGESQGSVTNPG